MSSQTVKYTIDFASTGVQSGPTPATQGVGEMVKFYYNYTGDDVSGGVLELQGRLHIDGDWKTIATLNTDGNVHTVDVVTISEMRLNVTTSQSSTSGTVHGVLKDSGIINTPPFEDEVARGVVPGWFSNHSFGRNPDIDGGSAPEDVWGGGGLYTGFPIGTSGETVTVVSSSSNDSSAGTGARTIIISGLDPNYNIQIETITMNGTTPVESTGVYVRLSRWEMVQSGNGYTNAGTITIAHSSTTANVFITDTPGSGGSLLLAGTVPAGRVALIKATHLTIERSTGGGTEAALTLMTQKSVTGEQRTLRHWTISELAPLDVGFEVPLAIVEKTDIWVRVDTVSANNSSISGDFEFTLAPAT